jgi:aryl-alcohol dehydrogenase-like predicted oxidoreductase
MQSLKLVEKAFDLGISGFDTSVNYVHNLNILGTFFKQPQNAKLILKIGSLNKISIRDLKADLQKLESISRLNIASIMLHSIQPAQVNDLTLKYIHDY